MSKICDCCGKEIEWNYFNLANKGDVCFACHENISKLQAGELSYIKLISPKTTPKLKDYLKECEKEGTEQNQKQNERKADPLYQDIHQLANDVHFIKNFIIFCLILTVIGCIIYFCQMTNMRY